MFEFLSRINSSTDQQITQTDNFKILYRIRAIALIGQVSLVIFTLGYLKIELPMMEIMWVLFIECLYQIYAAIKNNKTLITLGDNLFAIVFDALILASLVYFSGGANNPFLYLLLLPIALGIMMLNTRALIFVAALQLILYSLINLYPRELEFGEASPLASFHLHLAGMWVNFFLTVILLVIFGLIARNVMLKQNKKIQDLREKQLKDEQLLSLGIMSASAAHELGTPLSTIHMVVDDLHSEESHPERKKELMLVQEQIRRCKNILSDLQNKSLLTQKRVNDRDQQAETIGDRDLEEQLTTIIDEWLVYRPDIELEKNINLDLKNKQKSLPISVEQALINLLDNAADASREHGSRKVTLEIKSVKGKIAIEITDQGKGMSSENQALLGAGVYQSEKSDGLGWGWFLSNASIERVGGQVEVQNAKVGGLQVKITLPMDEL
ncbi:MAG: ATP-binding protein [Gammaproteobacteria bacterium]|nr:ATP-binding protein [Gammaproteobacteria bacterium]MDH5628883.1 ATP-binding protein [Gammaproteobacteria bacterium]